MALSPGARLGPYEILSVIGAGGMGEVYRARDTRLDRVVAIKRVLGTLAGDQDLRARFQHEARTIAALNHPHICTIHDVGHEDGIDYLVMEHLVGETLAERLTRGALAIDEALRTAIQIAEALDRAHRAGIVHRDLKPANVMLVGARAVTDSSARRSSRAAIDVKLLDFGLAKRASAAVAPGDLSVAATLAPSPSDAGMMLGTLQYMAPEQIEGLEAAACSVGDGAREERFETGVGHRDAGRRVHCRRRGMVCASGAVCPAVSSLRSADTADRRSGVDGALDGWTPARVCGKG